jgi:tetratricopeptide (TPR) repeat protein
MLKEMRRVLREILQPRKDPVPGAVEQRAPREAAHHHELGLALLRQGEKRAALASFRRALDLQHDHVPALFHAGQLHAELGEVEDARDCYSLALAFDPLSSASRIALAGLLAQHGGVDAAVTLLAEAVKQGTADASVYCRLASVLGQRGDAREAAAILEQAIDRFPDDPAPLVNLGLHRLGQTGDAREAEALFRRAVRLDPGLAEAQANLGLALQEQGRFDEALDHYERLIAESPGVVEYRWNRGVANLALGRFGAAWEDYELRKRRPDARGVHALYPFPAWDGSPLEGRSILVYGEQGLGDEIMFASCLPEVAARAGLCVIECDDRLVPIYRRSFPGARIEARGATRERDWRVACPGLELQAAVGSLPRWLRARVEDFPATAGYLVPHPGRAAVWRRQLEAAGAGATVGVSWRGGTRRTRGDLRSLTLGELAPLFDRTGKVFVVLQRDVTQEERAWLKKRSNLLLPEIPPDPEELAALISVLDLTITVPATTLHLAGALGRPVWALLTKSPEWRYLWQGERMPWYPSARLIRQAQSGDWAGVVSAVCERLERWPGGGP